jgi:hypothetical protein
MLGKRYMALRHEDIWGSEGIASPFLILALDGREWSASRLCCFTTGIHFYVQLRKAIIIQGTVIKYP